MKSTLKKIHVSFEETEKAFNRVRKELTGMGLLYAGTRLDQVECFHERFSIAALTGLKGWMGFYDKRDEGDKNIHIPAVYPSEIFPWSLFCGERNILDVLRHEFGHALADKYRKFFRGGIFKEAFGASYGVKTVFDGDDWADEYVTEYASTMTQEDFADTFMLFMKHKGKLPARYRGRRAIEKKWKTVAQIVKEIAAVV